MGHAAMISIGMAGPRLNMEQITIKWWGFPTYSCGTLNPTHLAIFSHFQSWVFRTVNELWWYFELEAPAHKFQCPFLALHVRSARQAMGSLCCAWKYYWPINHGNGKHPINGGFYIIGKSSMTGGLSVAMFDYRRVIKWLLMIHKAQSEELFHVRKSDNIRGWVFFFPSCMACAWLCKIVGSLPGSEMPVSDVCPSVSQPLGVTGLVKAKEDADRSQSRSLKWIEMTW
jgi:hypothetical protein